MKFFLRQGETLALSQKKCYNKIMEDTQQTSVENGEEIKVNKPKAFGKKIMAFMDKNYAMIFAPVLVFILYVAALFVYDVYPFGDKYTAASYDLSAQICPFIEHLFDVLDGKSSLTYSYAIVGGADVTGTFLYFFLSPFSFLFLVLGDGKVAYASSIVMIFKLMTVAVAGAWFTKKVFKNIPDYIAVAFGVIYTYCGYMFVANTYINWVDFLIYMPFCVAAFKHFVKTNKFLPFSILVACCIYTCFSIACFSLFTVFPALIVYALLCVEKERKNKFIAYLCLSFVVALLLALPVLLPALMAFLNSARGDGLLDGLWFGFTLSTETSLPENFDSSSFLNTYAQSLYRKWSYILSDSIFVVLTVLWFIRKGLKDRFAKFMLFAGIFTLLPLVSDEVMRLMNMGSYMSYALRFGFLNAIYFFGGACLCVEGLCYKPWNAYDGSMLFGAKKKKRYTLLSKLQNGAAAEPQIEMQPTLSEKTQNEGGMIEVNEKITKENAEETVDEKVEAPLEIETYKAPKTKFPYVWIGVIALLGAFAFGLMLALIINGGFKNFWAKFIEDSDTLKSMDSLASRFAHSLGGLEIIAILCVLVVIVAAVGFFLVWRKRISVRALTIVLSVLVGTQVVFYNSQLVVGNRSTQHVTLNHYSALSEQLNEMDDSYFRLRDYGAKVTACAPFRGNSNSFSVFSSVIDEDNFATYQLFGFDGNGKNSYKNEFKESKIKSGNTTYASMAFADSFLNYKYVFVAKGKRSTVEKSGYMEKVIIKDADGKEKHLQSGDYYIYKNTMVFPLGFRVDGTEGYKFVSPNTNTRKYRRENQRELYRYLMGMDKLSGSGAITNTQVKTLSENLWTKSADVKVGAGEITATVKNAKQGESLMLSFVASKGYKVTVNGKAAKLIDNDIRFLQVALEEGDNEVVFSYSSPYVKYAVVGVGLSMGGLLVVAFVLKKTKLVDVLSPVISWAGVGIAVAVVGFFMVFPTCVFGVKLITWMLL